MVGILGVDRIGHRGELREEFGVGAAERREAPRRFRSAARGTMGRPREGAELFGLRLGKRSHSEGRVEQSFAGLSGGGETVKTLYRTHRKLL